MRDCRGWFIHPFSVTYWWLAPAALVPGVLGTILVFLDQQISSAIVNRKEHKLKVRHFKLLSQCFEKIASINIAKVSTVCGHRNSITSFCCVLLYNESKLWSFGFKAVCMSAPVVM